MGAMDDALKCPNCGKVFKRTGNNQKYCSIKCRRDFNRERQNAWARASYHRRKKPNRCQRCGKEIPRYKWYCTECRLPPGVAKLFAICLVPLSVYRKIDKLTLMLKQSQSMVRSLQNQVDDLLEKNQLLREELKNTKSLFDHRSNGNNI